MTSTCKFCGKPICSNATLDSMLEAIANLRPTVCGECAAKHAQAKADEEKAALLVEWKRICPPLFHDTDLNHPGMPTGETRDAVLGWKPGPRGLIVKGNTRKGKTRLVWELLKRLTLERVTVMAVTSNQLASGCAAACGEGGDALIAWQDSLCEPQVLFIDDLGKFKLTERVESELFDIIDRRTSHNLPLIITTNFATGDDLLKTMSQDRGPAIVGRIREFCQSVTV